MTPNYIDTFPQGPAGGAPGGVAPDATSQGTHEQVGRTSIDGAGTSASNGLPDSAMAEVFNATAQVARMTSQGTAGNIMDYSVEIGAGAPTTDVERMGGAGTTGYNQ